MRALAPAKVREVRIHEDTGIAEVIVPDFQLSLAIGKEGQNARLAARLTGWRVDIKSETQLAEEEAGGGYAEGEWVEGPDGQLMWQPAEGGEAISAAEAGYGTIAGGEVVAADGASTPTPEVAPETGDLPDGTGDLADEEPAPLGAEDAAMHVDATDADEAADEIASDAGVASETGDGGDAGVAAEEVAALEETAGDQS